MREFSFPWSEGFFKGLRPNSTVPKNSPYLYEAYGVRVGSFGLESPVSIDTFETGADPTMKFPDIAWPMPQIIKTSIGTFIVDSTDLRSANSVYLLAVVLPGLSNTLNQQYHVADFGTYQFWTNGSTCILRDYLSVWQIYPAALIPMSVCNYKGQLILGGMGTTTNKNVVVWSGIGESDLDVLCSTDLGVLATDYSTQKNTSGNKRMKWSGQVYTVKELGKYVMIYGEDGISAMVGVSDPAPTFGHIDLKDFGIMNRDAVGGDDKGHVFVDNSGWVWSVDTELNFKRLGYREYVDALIPPIPPTRIVVSFDPELRDFYIASGVTGNGAPLGCLLLADGLSSIAHVPTSIIRDTNVYKGQIIGPRYVIGDELPYITTEVFDMRTRGIKQVTALEVGTQSDYVVVALDYRYNSDDAWRVSTYKHMSRGGLVFPQIAGVEFRIRMKASIT